VRFPCCCLVPFFSGFIALFEDRIVDSKFILRPELIESLFYLYRVTDKPIYRERAWLIFRSLEQYCKVPSGFSGLTDVNAPGSFNDSQQSFFFAETLKYLYLIFSEKDKFSFDTHILTTEAHILEMKQNSE